VGKRFVALMVGMLAVGAPLLGGIATGASAAAPSVVVAGRYRLYAAAKGSSTYNRPISVKLKKDQTGSDKEADEIAWALSGKKITIKFTGTGPLAGFKATYRGTVNMTGISSAAKPGTFSANDGFSGTWYAVRVSPS
jgi:hypothetical protein